MRTVKTVLLCLAGAAMLASCGAQEITEKDAMALADSYQPEETLKKVNHYKITGTSETTLAGKTQKKDINEEGILDESNFMTGVVLEDAISSMKSGGEAAESVDLNLGLKFYKNGAKGFKMVAEGADTVANSTSGAKVEYRIKMETAVNDDGLPSYSNYDIWMKTTMDTSSLGDLGELGTLLNSEMSMKMNSTFSYSFVAAN